MRRWTSRRVIVSLILSATGPTVFLIACSQGSGTAPEPIEQQNASKRLTRNDISIVPTDAGVNLGAVDANSSSLDGTTWPDYDAWNIVVPSPVHLGDGAPPVLTAPFPTVDAGTCVARPQGDTICASLPNAELAHMYACANAASITPSSLCEPLRRTSPGWNICCP
jgi:hypothetical protein